MPSEVLERDTCDRCGMRYRYNPNHSGVVRCKCCGSVERVQL